MKKTLLQQKYLDMIKGDSGLLHAVCEATREADGKKKSPHTVLTWARNNSPLLTMQSIQDAIRKYLGLSESRPITEAIEMTDHTTDY